MWNKKIFDFIKLTSANSHHSSGENTFLEGIRNVACLSEATKAFFITNETYKPFTVLASIDPKVIGIHINPEFSKKHLETNKIRLKRLNHKEVQNEVIFQFISDILIIPLKAKNQSGLLVLGFNIPLEDKKGLMDFSAMVQLRLLELMNNRFLNNSFRESQQQFDFLLQAIPQSIVLVEEDTNQAWVNNSAATLLSIPNGAIEKGQFFSALEILMSGADNLEKNKNFFANDFPKRKIFNEWAWHSKDPFSPLLSINCSPLVGGMKSGILWTFKNITAELESEKVKNQTPDVSNLLFSVLESSFSGIMAFKTDRDSGNEIVDFTCLYCNTGAKKLLKLSCAKLVGMPLIKILPTYKQSGLFKEYVKVIETEQPYHSENYFQGKGEGTWFQIIAIKLNDGFVVTFSDITERKRSEKTLIKNQAKIQAILENTTDIVCSIDREFRLTAMNSSLQMKVLQQAGISLEVGDILPLPVFTKLFFSNGIELFKRAFNGEQLIEETEVSIMGSSIYYEFSFNPIKNDKGHIKEIAIFGHNITRRKNSESLIREKNQLLKGLLENLPVIIFRIDSNGNFIELTGAGLKKLNLEANDMVGSKILDLFPDLERIISKKENYKNKRILSKGINLGRPWVFENYIFQDETSPGGFVGFALDITAQNKFEHKLQKAKESAENASLAKSYFLANQSHEIRTPINAILGFAQLMKNNQWTAESEEYLDFIISSGQILMNLLGNILDLAKIENGKLELMEEPFCFQEVVNSNIHPYIFKAKEKGLLINIHFDDKIPEYLHGDAGKIVQIIINLISNSLKFTKQGEIKLTFSRIFTPEDKKATVKITVSDTGIGIPKELQKKIFQNFTQAEPTIHKKYGGSGLGLSIVKELVILMGGSLGVESPGELKARDGSLGSTFWFTLPLSIATPPANEPGTNFVNNEINFNGKLKVLVVDDNHLNQRLTSTMLNKIGCKVTIAENGKEALNELVNEKFHLIFMDVRMPILNGYETTQKIRETLNSKIPIIGLSSSVYKEDVEYCFTSGMDDYLGRPFTRKSFLDRVIKWGPKLNTSLNGTISESLKSDGKITCLSFLKQVLNDDKQLIIETVQLYIQNHEKMVKELGHALIKNDFKSIANVSHNMRSSLQAVKLDSLYESLKQIEIIAKNNKKNIKLNKHYIDVKEISLKAKLELEDSLITLKN